MENSDYKVKLIRRTTDFSLAIMRMIDSLSKIDNSTKVITNQLMRSATSIGANIVEGQGSSSRKDFANFISHAFKSANETSYWLTLLLESKKIPESFSLLRTESDELAKILASTVIKLRK